LLPSLVVCLFRSWEKGEEKKPRATHTVPYPLRLWAAAIAITSPPVRAQFSSTFELFRQTPKPDLCACHTRLTIGALLLDFFLCLFFLFSLLFVDFVGYTYPHTPKVRESRSKCFRVIDPAKRQQPRHRRNTLSKLAANPSCY